jgi:hypothetical protein
MLLLKALHNVQDLFLSVRVVSHQWLFWDFVESCIGFKGIGSLSLQRSQQADGKNQGQWQDVDTVRCDKDGTQVPA